MTIHVFEIKRGDLVKVGSVFRPIVDARGCWLGDVLGITIHFRDDMGKPIPFTYRYNDLIEVFRDE